MIAAEVQLATWYSSIVSCKYQRYVSVVHRDKTPKIQAGHSYYRCKTYITDIEKYAHKMIFSRVIESSGGQH